MKKQVEGGEVARKTPFLNLSSLKDYVEKACLTDKNKSSRFVSDKISHNLTPKCTGNTDFVFDIINTATLTTAHNDTTTRQ